MISNLLNTANEEAPLVLNSQRTGQEPLLPCRLPRHISRETRNNQRERDRGTALPDRGTCTSHDVFTSTRRNVAGITVPSVLVFWAMNSFSSSSWRLAARPFFSAASN